MKKVAQTLRLIFELGLETKEIVVLAYLMSCANNNTCECYPSVGTIADKCSMGKTATREALHSLEQKGIIKIRPWAFEDQRTGKSRQTNNHYTVLCMTEGYQKTNPPPSLSGGEITILNTTIGDEKSCVEVSSKSVQNPDFMKCLNKSIDPLLITGLDKEMPYLHNIAKVLMNLWNVETVLVCEGIEHSQSARQAFLLKNLSVDWVQVAIEELSKKPLNTETTMAFLLSRMALEV